MSRVAIVTGANKGIGFETTRAISKCGKFKIVYLTSRNEELGMKALNELKRDSNISAELKYHQLDITNENSILEFEKYILNTHGGFDCLVNNAAMGPDLTRPGQKGTHEETEALMKTNFWGTLNLMKALFPHIKVNH